MNDNVSTHQTGLFNVNEIVNLKLMNELNQLHDESWQDKINDSAKALNVESLL